MRYIALSLLSLLVSGVGCGTDPQEIPPPDPGTCVLDIGTVTQEAIVTSHTCESQSAEPIPATLPVENGIALGAALQLTGVTSYDGASVGATCVYDVTARVEAHPCVINLAMRVVVK